MTNQKKAKIIDVVGGEVAFKMLNDNLYAVAPVRTG